jgi:cell division protein FtsB
VSSAETTGVFTLLGAVIGFIVSIIGTHINLRQQQSLWKKERQLEELRTRRDEIFRLVEDLSALEIDFESESLIATDAVGRLALYKMSMYLERTGNMKLSGKLGSLFQFQNILKVELAKLEKQIDDVLEG